MTTTIAANAVAAAHIQGLHAFMAAEAKAAATDTQLEAATGLAGIPSMGPSANLGCCVFK